MLSSDRIFEVDRHKMSDSDDEAPALVAIEMESNPSQRVPVTIITGYLGEKILFTANHISEGILAKSLVSGY